MFKVSYFLEVLPIIASKVNITFELTISATIFALIVGVKMCIRDRKGSRSLIAARGFKSLFLRLVDI